VSKEWRVALLLLVGAGVMVLSVLDVFDQVTTSVIGFKDVTYHEAPNEFLLTVGARITFGLYLLYLGARLHLTR
jgi:hypothetical protein